MRLFRTVYAPLLALCFLGAPLAHGVADRELVAKQAAETWLVFVDEGKYAEALVKTAPELREEITKQAWVDGLKMVRTPLGEVNQRKLQRLFATSVLPGNIEGDFVVVNFRTVFAGREEPANEILVMTPGPTATDGAETWQVLSFYIE